MKPKIQLLSIFFILCLAAAAALPRQAQSGQQWTQTLLPVWQSGAAAEDPKAKGLLWVQNEPQKMIFLQFDLSELPSGLHLDDFKACTLRLVAQNVVYEPAGNPNTGGQFVIVKGRLANDDFTEPARPETIISLSTLSRSNNVALKATEAFRAAVYNEYAGDKKISLQLFSDSHKASSLFYSSDNSGEPANPSNLPRLVVEYMPPSPELRDTLSWSQLQQNPEHTGRTAWKPFQNPTGFSLAKINMPQINGSTGTIADYPLIYRGNIYLVYKVLDRNFLLAIDYQGRELWRRDIGMGTMQRSPVVSRNGIFYAVTEKKITGYDLSAHGQTVDVFPTTDDLPGKPSAYTDLTAGNDGSLFLPLQENAVNCIYGFTAQLKPFFKSNYLGTIQQRISTVSVSTDGRAVFAETAEGAVVIDVINPSREQKIQLGYGHLEPWDYYHVPIAGSTGGVMIFSDFTDSADRGNAWGYTVAQRVWDSPGKLSFQPVLGSNALVYFIQGGGLQAHRYDEIGPVEAAPDAGLKASSNLVMDGADNIFFWDNGFLHGYDARREALFTKIPLTAELKAHNVDEPGALIQGPEQFLRLMLGPDGTLWANNKLGRSLYAFKPTFAEADVTLKQENIQTKTVYRATGSLAVGSLKVKDGTQILLQAQQQISFKSGFAVQKGAELLCRTGF